MMGTAPITPYKGKKSGEERLGFITNYLAFFFICLSILEDHAHQNG